MASPMPRVPPVTTATGRSTDVAEAAVVSGSVPVAVGVTVGVCRAHAVTLRAQPTHSSERSVPLE